MPQKYQFVCVYCNFKAETDRVPFGCYFCNRCSTWLGLCRACINRAAEQHARVCRPLTRGESLYGTGISGRADSGGGN